MLHVSSVCDVEWYIVTDVHLPMLKRVRYANEVRATSVGMGRRDNCGGCNHKYAHVRSRS